MTDSTSPSSVAASAFEALARRDWSVLVEYIDAEALTELREHNLKMLLQQVEHWEAGGGDSIWFRFDDYVIADHLDAVADEEIPFFPRRPTLGELAALTPGEYFQRWCAAGFEQGPEGTSFSERPDLKRTIIGAIQESTDLAFVLYRREHRNQGRFTPAPELWSPGPMEIMPLVRRDHRWGLALNDDLGDHGFPFFGRMDPPGKKPPLHELPVVQYPDAPTAGPEPDSAEVGTLVHRLQTVLDALQRHEWSEAAKVMEPSVLAELQEEQIMVASRFADRHAEFDEATSNPSGVVARIQPVTRKPDSDDLLVPLQPTPMTIGQLTALSPAEFFAVIFESAAQSVYGELLDYPQVVVGGIPEAHDVVQLLYRTDGNESDARKLHRDRAVMRRTSGEWRLTLPQQYFRLLLPQWLPR